MEMNALLEEHRKEVELRFARMEAQLVTLTALAASAQSQISQHTAVCAERQRLSEQRQAEFDERDRQKQTEFRLFMAESRTDREKMRDMVRDWALKGLAAGVLGSVSIIGVLISSGALNLLGHH